MSLLISKECYFLLIQDKHKLLRAIQSSINQKKNNLIRHFIHKYISNKFQLHGIKISQCAVLLHVKYQLSKKLHSNRPITTLTLIAK